MGISLQGMGWKQGGGVDLATQTEFLPFTADQRGEVAIDITYEVLNWYVLRDAVANSVPHMVWR